MSGSAPRALEDILPPRHLSDVGARPLNLTSKDFPVVSTVDAVLVR